MFYSKCFLSKKGPLSAIWVAAYFFKNLKKAQVQETDIPSSVDEILKNEWDAVAYRVLAYFLLGVARIYSKKVDYLYNECNKLLVRLSDFVDKEKCRAQNTSSSISFGSIVLPERFELDAFDLPIAEDFIRDHTRQHGEITLRDEVWNDEGTGHYFAERFDFEKFEACADICRESGFFPHEMEVGTETRTSCDQELMLMVIDTEDVRGQEGMQEAYVNMGPQNEPLDPNSRGKIPQNIDGNIQDLGLEALPVIETVDVLGQEDMREAYVNMECQNEPLGPNGSCEKDPLTIDGHKQDSGADKIQEASREMLRGDMFDQQERMSPPKIQNVNSPRHGIAATAGGGGLDTLNHSMNEMGDVTADEASVEKLLTERFVEAERITDDQRSIEKLQIDKFSEAERMNFEASVIGWKGNPEVPQNINENNTPASKPNVTLSESENCMDHAAESPLLATPDAIARLRISTDPGTSTMQFKVSSSTAAKDGARASRKRKCLIDDTVVLPNSYIKRCIEDSSGLISKRRRVPQNNLDAWRRQRLSSLSRCLFDPLISCSSLDIQSRFFLKEIEFVEPCERSKAVQSLGIINNFGVIKPLQHGEIASEASVSFKQLEQAEIAPETSLTTKPSEQAEIALETSVAAEPLQQDEIAPETAVAAERLEHAEIALETAVTREPSEHAAIAPVTPGRESASTRLFKKCRVSIPARAPSPENSLESCEEMSLLINDQNFELSPTHTAEGGESQQNGYSERTSTVAEFLKKTTLDQNLRDDEKTVNLLHLCEGRTRKESAKLFYEILVLKTKGCVDVRQEDSYGDILVREAPQADQ